MRWDSLGHVAERHRPYIGEMGVQRIEDLDPSRQYTYSDYVTWRSRERVELLRGWIDSVPAPNRLHREVSRNVFRGLLAAFENRDCKVYSAPFDVRLPRTRGGETVVQPDLCVVCNAPELTDRGCTGAPDLVVEILSLGDSSRDLLEKYDLYEESGVPEYWIIDPINQYVLRYVLRGGTYIGLHPETQESPRIQSDVFADFGMSGEDVFRG